MNLEAFALPCARCGAPPHQSCRTREGLDYLAEYRAYFVHRDRKLGVITQKSSTLPPQDAS